MKNEEFGKNFEQLLKSKMDEMAETVDCFDKISERVFPADNEDFSGSGYAVTDLETVSPKRKSRRIIKWTALAGAAAAAVFVLPKTDIPRKALMLFTDNSSKCEYEAILDEIESETKDDSYYIMDIPLEYYIENQILVTPLMSCPFEENDKDDAMVRLYIRQIDGWDTNQVYAVEYLGTYSENNIVAAAKSKYTITADDIKMSLSEPAYIQGLAAESVSSCFFGEKEGTLSDINGNYVSLASFEYNSVVKDENGIRKLKTEVIYGNRSAFGKDPEYFYDIKTHVPAGEQEIPEADKMWKASCYFNGNSAFPEESGQEYIRETIFSEGTAAVSQKLDFVDMPLSADLSLFIGKDACLRGEMLQNLISCVMCPANVGAAVNTRIYFSYDNMYSEEQLELVSSDDNDYEAVYRYPDYEINEYETDMEAVAEAQREIIEQLEVQAKLQEEDFRIKEDQKNLKSDGEKDLIEQSEMQKMFQWEETERQKELEEQNAYSDE